MTDETKEAIQNIIFYYDHHLVAKFVRSDEQRLREFVIEDFNKLLDLLRPVVFEAQNA